MPVSSVWTNPSAAGTLDLATGAILTETWVDAIASNFLFLGGTAGVITQSAFAASGTLETTTSNSGVLMAAPQVTITTGGGNVLVFGGVTLANTTLGAISNQYVSQDSVLALQAIWHEALANGWVTVTVANRYAAPSAGSHTYALGWATSAGTLTTTTQANRWILVLEQRR